MRLELCRATEGTHFVVVIRGEKGDGLGLDRNMRDQFAGHPHFERTAEFCALYDNPAFDPIPDNDAVIAAAARVADVVVAAWGAHGTHRDRGDAVARLIAEVAGRAVHRLSLTGDGQPGHPLYLKADLRPVLYSLSDGGA